MLRHYVTFLFFLCVSSESSAQDHFTNCAERTGANATMIIPASASVVLGDRPLATGSEIAVFTPDGVCAGVAIWKGEATALSIWGDDTQSPEKDGFAPGEAFIYRVWDAADGVEHDGGALPTTVTLSSARPFYRSENAYAEDAIYELSTISIATSTGVLPEEFALHPNYPNPFNPSTVIRYDLPKAADVKITVYDAAGARVAVLLDQPKSAGAHELRWEAGELSSGTYFVRIQNDDQMRIRPMVLLR